MRTGGVIGSVLGIILTFSTIVSAIALFPLSVHALSSPDLTVTSVSFSPSSASQGQSISVTFTVKNQGTTSSGSFSNRVSLATTRWGTDISLGNFSIGSLGAGASQTSTVSVTIPTSVSPSSYWVTVFTDGFQQIAESDENNNIGSSDPSKFTIPTYTLSTSVSPSGSGTISPSGGSYAAGGQVTLTATPASGYSFSNWGGDASGSQNPVTITMNSNKSITAYFTAAVDPVYWLAKAIMSEASIGTREERVAVGWTVLNRLDSGIYGNTVEAVVKSGYAYGQEPSQEIRTLAQDLWNRKIPDLTGGATHFFSPRSMTSGYGPYKISGTELRVLIPYWAIPKLYSKTSPPPANWEITSLYQTIDNTERVSGLSNVRNNYFMFYRPIRPVPTVKMTTTLSEYYSASGKSLPPLSERARMYEAFGLGSTTGYTGTAQQNTQLLNALKQRQICPLTVAEAVAQLIEHEATGGIPVTVNGRFYIILILSNRIESAKLEVVPNSGTTKVYVYGDRNEPVSSPDIAREIGVVDYIRELQKEQLDPSYVKQKMDALIQKMKILAGIQFGEESINILTEVPTSISKEAVIKWIGGKAADQFLNKMRELNEELMKNLQTAESNYAGVFSEVLRNKSGIADYDTANVVLESYLSAMSYERRFSFLYGMIYGRYVGDVGLLVKLSEITLRSLTIGISEELLARGIEKDYNAFCQMEQRKLQGELSKLYGATEYTLELARTPRITVIVHSPVELRVYDSQERVTGVVNGQEKNEIPHSTYSEKTVTIFSPTDSYRYEVVGTGEGSYDLVATKIADGKVSAFAVNNNPVSAKARHQYTVDWETVSRGGKGINIQIDSDGDGTFERTLSVSPEEGGRKIIPPWVWIAISALVAFVVALVVNLHFARKRVAKG